MSIITRFIQTNTLFIQNSKFTVQGKIRAIAKFVSRVRILELYSDTMFSGVEDQSLAP